MSTDDSQCFAPPSSLLSCAISVLEVDDLSFSCPLLATVETWDHIFSVNARGAYLCYKYAAMHMIEQGRGGRIIGASSVSGKFGASYDFVCTFM